MKPVHYSWPALLLSPSLALTNLVITFALVTPSCANQQHSWLHAVTTISILISILLTLLAAHAISLTRANQKAEDAAMTRPYFLASVALWSGIFFTTTIAAEWLGQWLLSPCL